MALIAERMGRKELAQLLSEKDREISDLKVRLENLEMEKNMHEEELKELEERLDISQRGTVGLRKSYLKRLEDQTRSTDALAETVKTILNAIKEISLSYEEMLGAIHSLGAITRELGDSFRIQAETQDQINQRTEEANVVSENEVDKAKSLKSELGQLESIRTFMSGAMDTIEDVSSRLSLLSMNGRIEAAHAGAAGRGFAVVAQEMLKLQQENGEIIASQRTQLSSFLPLMSAMQDESDSVEAHAREQQSIIREIARGSSDLGDQTTTNQKKIDDLISAVEELAASIEQGKRTTDSIEEQTTKREFIFTEEVFVSNKVNNLDRFLFDLSAKADSMAEAGQLLVNEYQKISVLNGKSYVWQADSWLVTDRKKLPAVLQDQVASMGDRVMVCIGQTSNNPTYPKPLHAPSGILAVHPIDDLANPDSPLQGLRPLVDRIGLSLDDLKHPGRIDIDRSHGNMHVNEAFSGDFKRVMKDKIERGKLICSFSFGGPFHNGDLMLNHLLSDYQRSEEDARKFGMIGESMVFAFQSIVERGRYWLTD